jgi:hypothetical protein
MADRHHRIHALEVLIVFEANFDARGRRRLRPRRLDRRIAQIKRVHNLQIAANGLRPIRHGPIDPRADPNRTPGGEVASEARWDFDRCFDRTALQALLDIPIVGERRLFSEVGRAAQLLEISAAFVALIVIHDGKRQIVDVGRDSEAEHHHQKHRTEQGEGQPDGIAHKLDRLAV